jgi:PAS domain S-box-containing protein
MPKKSQRQNISTFNLKDSEEKYRLLVENLNDAIVITQRDKYIYFNTQFATLLGYKTEELLSQDYRTVYSKQTIDILKKREEKRKQGKKVPSRYETVFIKKNGEEVLVEANVTIIEHHGDKATFAVIRDITEQKKARKKLAESEKLYRMLFELSPAGILVEDLDGTILDANPAFCQSLGYKKEELINKNVTILAHPDVVDQVSKNISRLKKGKLLNHQVQSIRKDGSSCYMELHESKILLPDGRKGILCIAADVTERLRAEDDRIRRERMEGVLELAGAVCHELNQPMTVASINSEIMNEKMDRSALNDKLNKIKKELKKMGHITRKLMHITRYETREYLDGRKILDIDKAISDDD